MRGAPSPTLRLSGEISVSPADAGDAATVMLISSRHMPDFRESAWPKDAIRKWLADNWARWMAERPGFFTEQWIAAIPADLRPDLPIELAVL